MKLETTAIIAQTRSEQYQKMLEKEKEVEGYSEKYKEIMKHIELYLTKDLQNFLQPGQ